MFWEEEEESLSCVSCAEGDVFKVDFVSGDIILFIFWSVEVIFCDCLWGSKSYGEYFKKFVSILLLLLLSANREYGLIWTSILV